MNDIIQSIGTVRITKTIPSKSNPDLVSTIAVVDFNRTNSAGFPLLDSVFLPKDRTIAVGSYLFSLVFKTRGTAIMDKDGNPIMVADDEGNPTDVPRYYLSNSIRAIAFSSLDETTSDDAS